MPTRSGRNCTVTRTRRNGSLDKKEVEAEVENLKKKKNKESKKKGRGKDAEAMIGIATAVAFSHRQRGRPNKPSNSYPTFRYISGPASFIFVDRSTTSGWESGGRLRPKKLV
jgi:hypothetical protein